MDIYKPNLDKNDSFWASSGTKAADVALFGVERVKRKGDAQNTKSNTIIVPPATFWAKKDSYDPPSKSKFRGLLLPIKPVPLHPSSGGRGPTLTKPTVEDFAASSESTSEKGYSISAFLVNDGYYNSDLERLLASPEYYVYRTTKWKPVDGGLPCPWDSPDNCVYHYNVSKGTSETTTWNNSIGIAFSQSLEMETSFKPLGVGAGANLTLGLEESYSHEFGGDEGTSTEKGTEREFPVSPGTFAVAFESESTVEVYRKNDTTKNSANLVRRYTVDNDVARVEIKTFPLQKEKEEDGSEGCQNVKTRDLVECGLPAVKIVSFPKNTEIKSASGKHYLILTKYGSLEVRNGDVGRLQHAHVWSVDQKHSEVGSHKYPIGSVWFEDGRLCAVASRTMSDTSSEAWNDTKHPTWCSMPLEDATKDALLEIDEEGNLRVVDADGEVIWNSKYDEAD